MADTILTITQLEDLFQSLTAQILGYTGEDVNNVRISWATAGQPGFKITDNLVFLRVTSSDSPINKQRDIVYENGIETESYTRVIESHWTFYGNNGFDTADFIRHSLYLQTYKDILKTNNLFMILDVPNINRIPEEFEGQWWQRSDLTINFNELVVRKTAIDPIEFVNIKLVDDNNNSRNITIGD